MQKQSQKSVFLPKLADLMNSQDLCLKKQQYIRRAFFYRSEHSKTTEQKKSKKDRKNVEFEHKKQSIQKKSVEDNTRVRKRRKKQYKAEINHSESLLTNIKQKLTYVKRQVKIKRQPQTNLKFQQQEKIINHFGFSLTTGSNKKYCRSKHKQAKVKTQMEQSSIQIKNILEDKRISGLLKVKKAAQFKYILPQEAVQKGERQEHRIKQCLNSLKKAKGKRTVEIPITSINGWNSKFESSSEFFT